MKIHKEGYIIIPVASLLIGLLYGLLFWLIALTLVRVILGLAAFIFWILVIRFFRNPDVNTQASAEHVIAPAEGKVVVIEKTLEDEYLMEERIQVSIFMSPLNVHVNRSPVKGKVTYFRYHPGKYLVAWHPKSSTENERTSIGFETETGVRLLMRQIAGAAARRIRFYKKENDPVEAGAEVGFIRFGSRVDLFLPLTSKILVKIGDKTYGGRTVIAEL